MPKNETVLGSENNCKKDAWKVFIWESGDIYRQSPIFSLVTKKAILANLLIFSIFINEFLMKL